MRIKFPKINPTKLERYATPLKTSDEFMNCLEVRHLVLAWDKDEFEKETPSYALGFLKRVTYSDPTSVKFTIDEPLCSTHEIVELNYDNVAKVDDDHCPKVFYNNGTRQSVGYLIGLIQDVARGTYDCVVKVPPFKESKVDIVNVDGITYVEDIKLGIKFIEEECNQSKEAPNA